MTNMYVAFYRWRLKPGTEKVFEDHWNRGTLLFRNDHRALGSRLHKADDGTWFAYAQWPSREMYHSKRELSAQHKETLNKMAECVLESFPPILGDVACDLLLSRGVDVV